MVRDVFHAGRAADHAREAASRKAPQRDAVAANGGSERPRKGGADGRDPHGVPAVAADVGAEGGQDGIIKQVVVGRIVHDVDHGGLGGAEHGGDDGVDALGQTARP